MFVINKRERDLFLPDFNPGDYHTDQVSYEWVDTETLDNNRWRDMLEHYQPTVLVTAWSSPRIPESWALEPGCPLRYVCQITGTVKHVVSRPLMENGLLVSNWGSLISHTIAEHALLLVLGALRSVTLWPQSMKKPTYSVLNSLPVLKTRSLRGKRVGLHGFGAIARELVQMLKPHHVHLFAYSAPVPRAFMESQGVTYCATLEELFSQSDILIECEGLTSVSKGSVNEKILRLLPEDAVFVNVGRALVTDEAALIRLARERRLRAAVDVFQKEPQPLTSPWFEVPNAFLSPHIAGPTGDLYPGCGARALENVDRFLKGECPLDSLSLQAYDRVT